MSLNSNNWVPIPGGRSPAFRSEDPIKKVDAQALDLVGQAADDSPRRIARLCFHSSSQDPMQAMVITLAGHQVVEAHRQSATLKVFSVMRGSITVAFFDEQGEQLRRLGVGEGAEQTCIGFNPWQWHALASSQGGAVYLETVNSSNTNNKTEWQPWTGDLKESSK